MCIFAKKENCLDKNKIDIKTAKMFDISETPFPDL